MFAVRERLQPAAHFLDLFAGQLAAPIWYQSAGAHVGFRYTAPDARHFCLLKGVRSVSGMNACIQLALGGYVQEIAVIIRTVVECTSLMDWVRLAAEPDGSLRSDPQQTYVKTYFDDYRRDNPGESLKLTVRQGDVHRDVGSWLDEGAEEIGIQMNAGSARLMSNVYQTGSSYVHARYPEVMDMYGGRPGAFHLNGMRGTPKDNENLEVVETYATTVNLAVAGVARHFRPPFTQTESSIASWLGRL
ncbi:MAG: hypothetical protein JWP49_199 [Phenylobacterium sp.]|nr:hypothetical protein [Phenylobacterium sp.]